MPDFELAQANIAHALHPLEDERMRGFVEALEAVNAAADAHRDFIWRLQTESGDATEIRAFPDPLIVFNMSVWRSIEGLLDYTYRTLHGQFFARRREWFAPSRQASPPALWWVEAGARLSVEEGVRRLEHLWQKGPSSVAFTFKQTFDPHGRPR